MNGTDILVVWGFIMALAAGQVLIAIDAGTSKATPLFTFVCAAAILVMKIVVVLL